MSFQQPVVISQVTKNSLRNSKISCGAKPFCSPKWTGREVFVFIDGSRWACSLAFKSRSCTLFLALANSYCSVISPDSPSQNQHRPDWVIIKVMQIFVLHVYLNTPDEVRQAPGREQVARQTTQIRQVWNYYEY